MSYNTNTLLWKCANSLRVLTSEASIGIGYYNKTYWHSIDTSLSVLSGMQTAANGSGLHDIIYSIARHASVLGGLSSSYPNKNDNVNTLLNKICRGLYFYNGSFGVDSDFGDSNKELLRKIVTNIQDGFNYFARTGITDSSVKAAILQQKHILEQQNLWARSWVIDLKQSYNVGSGNVVMTFGGWRSDDLDIIGGPAWGISGMTFVGSSSQYLLSPSVYGFKSYNDTVCTGCAYADGYLYIGDFVNGRIVKMTKKGAYVSIINTPLPPNSLQGIALRGDGTFYVGDFINRKVHHLSAKGQLLGSSGVMPIAINGVAYDASDDSLWVVQDASSVVLHLSASSFTSLGNITTTAVNPDGIVIDPNDGNLWITADGTGSSDSILMKSNKANGNQISAVRIGLRSVEHIAFDSYDNTLWITSDDLYHESWAHGNRVHHFTTSGVSAELSALNIFVRAKPTSPSGWLSGSSNSSNPLISFWDPAGNPHYWGATVRTGSASDPLSLAIANDTNATFTNNSTGVNNGSIHNITTILSPGSQKMRLNGVQLGVVGNAANLGHTSIPMQISARADGLRGNWMVSTVVIIKGAMTDGQISAVEGILSL